MFPVVLAAAVPSLTAAWVLDGGDVDAGVGDAFSSGDFNGDAYSDLLVGAPGAHPQDVGDSLGAAFLYLGSPTGVDTVSAWEGAPIPGDVGYGVYVASAGDVNGDGFDDVLVSSNIDLLDETARTYLYLGSATGLPTKADWNVVTYTTFAEVGAAGDVDGDGYDEVAVWGYGVVLVFRGGPAGPDQDPSWTLTEGNIGFGGAASAGDVNGDGYDDMIVGATGYANPDFGEGAAFVYHGSAAGLVTKAAAVLESNLYLAAFGVSVASAGDVNADGFGDVIVGAYSYGNGEVGEGRAYVFLGSATGVATDPAWTAEPDLAYAVFGTSVSAAGDVDADGYDDVIVGAPNVQLGIDGVPEEDERGGRFYVFLGYAGGVAPTPAYMVVEEQIGALFGQRVGSAGDVNGDGYDDLLAGSVGYDDAENPVGFGYVAVYLGGPVADLDDDGVPDALDLCFGMDASGDLDQDGYCDTAIDGAVQDCDEANAAIHPDAAEVCDDLTDNNCDGEVDEGCAEPLPEDPAEEPPLDDTDAAGEEVLQAGVGGGLCAVTSPPAGASLAALVALLALRRRRRIA